MAKFKSLKIGDTVRVVSLADTQNRCGLNPNVTASVGATFTVKDLQRFGKGCVQLSNGWWYSPKGLEVLTPDEPTESAPEPVVHTKDDFKYTRVRVKETGALGVILGRTAVGHLVVLHDEASESYHDGEYLSVDTKGAEKRMYYYPAHDLEIIGGVQ